MKAKQWKATYSAHLFIFNSHGNQGYLLIERFCISISKLFLFKAINECQRIKAKISFELFIILSSLKVKCFFHNNLISTTVSTGITYSDISGWSQQTQVIESHETSFMDLDG